MPGILLLFGVTLFKVSEADNFDLSFVITVNMYTAFVIVYEDLHLMS